MRERRRKSKPARGEEESQRDRITKEKNKKGRKGERNRKQIARARTRTEDNAARTRDNNECVDERVNTSGNYTCNIMPFNLHYYVVQPFNDTIIIVSKFLIGLCRLRSHLI